MAGFEKHQIEAFSGFFINTKKLKLFRRVFRIFSLLLLVTDCVLEGILVFKILWN